MKTLHLMRHAKSSWQQPELGDHDRHLNDRGRRDAPRMGIALAETCVAQPIHCSSAVRARETLKGLIEAWPALALQSHTIDEALYTFDYRDVLAWLREDRGGCAAGDSCFILGHNPALTDLCNQLLGRPALDNLPTAGYLRLLIPVDHWADLAEGSARLEDLQFPRDLP
jgi:phosphohistidine phosphatase